MAICPICDNEKFDRIDFIDFGGWMVEKGELSRSAEIFDIGSCCGCGHVMIFNDYTKETFHRIYHETHQDPVFWGESLADSIAPYYDMITFCSPAALTPSSLVADIGCGPGAILEILHSTFGMPFDRLVGIDFNRRLPPLYRFIEADLNAPNIDLPEGMDIAFLSHVLEHLPDPRVLLRRVHASLKNTGFLYIEVPDTLSFSESNCGPINLINQQHIHYFIEASLTRLVTGCGFDVERVERVTTGCLPRLKMLVRPRREPPATAVAVVASLAGLRTRRRLLAEEIVACTERGEAVGIWGVGADFSRMIEECAAFADAVSKGRVALFDLGHAGRRYAGVNVLSPSGIADLPGMVFLTPALGDVRLKMHRFADLEGLPLERIIDRHRGDAERVET